MQNTGLSNLKFMGQPNQQSLFFLSMEKGISLLLSVCYLLIWSYCSINLADTFLLNGELELANNLFIEGLQSVASSLGPDCTHTCIYLDIFI